MSNETTIKLFIPEPGSAALHKQIYVSRAIVHLYEMTIARSNPILEHETTIKLYVPEPGYSAMIIDSSGKTRN